MTRTNDYKTDDEMANEPNLTKLLDNCYRHHFTDVREIIRPQKKELQVAGIDVIINCLNIPDPIFIDEKIRREDYGDILLEEFSDYDRRILGWLLENKRTHFIAYIWKDNKKMLLIPYTPLRNAFLTNKENWINKFGRVFADNNGYRTSNIPVPKSELFDSFWRCSWFTW